MKKILGSSPLTSIAGYLLSGLMIYNEVTSAGETNKVKIGVAVGVAILGRLAKDRKKQPQKF